MMRVFHEAPTPRLCYSTPRGTRGYDLVSVWARRGEGRGSTPAQQDEGFRGGNRGCGGVTCVRVRKGKR